MSVGLAFWILMLIWLVFSGLSFSGRLDASYGWGGSLLLFILLLLLGWGVFGAPIR